MTYIGYDLSQYEYEEDFFEDENFEAVTKENFEGNGRWDIQYSQVFRHKDGTYWKAYWYTGATENQETDLDLHVVQVEPYEVTITKYKEVKNV
jgi:hypothetical protein